MLTMFPDRYVLPLHRVYPRRWMDLGNPGWRVYWSYLTRFEESQRFGFDWESSREFSVLAFGYLVIFYKKETLCKASPHR